ncbi:aldehyde dehydrogenase family protein [Sphingobium tyrosinilyticum]|uniref:Aldehyde dehydrogenase family protein n=1 Tax=Sphingobium tyrosinilyticum TaxID=2715436 RepID=A0ABV9F1Q2_9SPHN
MATAPQTEGRTVAHYATDMLIGGRAVAGRGDPVTVINPSTGLETIRFAGASIDQFKQAIEEARTAADKGDWAALSPVERVTILRRFMTALSIRADAMKALLVTETGCPVGSPALYAQLASPVQTINAMLDLYLRLPEIEENPLTLEERVNPLGTVVQSVRRHVPIGVVAAISAYNFPMYINLWKIMPALAAGNVVILRPSPLTPLSALAMVEVAIETGLPAGVLSILAEQGAEGALLMTTDPAVDMITFTGSSDVGAKVMAQGAPTMKRVQLELGGKSAQIFLPDRVEAAYAAAATVCLAHAGQGCVLGTRVFVPEEKKAEVIAAMKASLENVRLGDSDDPATVMGPVISAAQVARCERYVELAVQAGATVALGGKRVDRQGFYFEPTILDVPNNKNPAAQDEIFGPVIAVIGYRDVDHAIEMANDSRFGLSGYVHGKDARQALAVAKRIRSGTVNVNCFMMSGNASSGGHKMSGIGRERGVEGIRIYQEMQVLNFAN